MVTAETPVGNSEERITFFTVLKSAGFRNLWLGQTISQIGDYFAFLAMTVTVAGFSTDPTSTTAAVSGMMISFTLPRLIFGVLAGVFVDRWDRRRTMIVSDVLRVFLALLFIPAFMMKSLALMYAVGFVMSAVGTLFIPAKGALIPKLVPSEQLMAANSLSQTSMMLANFVGPALAGATFALAGNGNQWVAYAVDACSFVISAVTIYMIRLPREATRVYKPQHRMDGRPTSAVWAELKVGLQALLLNKAIATLAAVFAITMLGVGAMNVLWVSFLKAHFGFSQAELAWRFSLIDIAFFAGMVGASVISGNFLARRSPKWFIVWGLVGAGAMTMPLGYLPDYWLVGVAMFLVGIFVAPINTGAGTFMQLIVPNSQLGRVGGGIGTITDTATLLSMSLAGVLGAFIGIPAVFLLAGLMCIGGGLLALFRLPALTMEDKVQEEEMAEPAA
ncbi:MAG: MFS transporter [Chloroflexota bacterium]|nr:MFS transporter [Chloroflexota bacterium]